MTKSGLLLNWCEKFVAVCIKGRWVRTRGLGSVPATARVVEVGDRVCLLYSNRLYVVAGDGKVTAHSNYLDDPAIAVNNTPGKSVETTVPSTPDAVAWGTDRLLLLTPHLAGYDLATGKPINVEPIHGPRSPQQLRENCFPTARGPSGSASRRAQADRERLLSGHAGRRGPPRSGHQQFCRPGRLSPGEPAEGERRFLVVRPRARRSRQVS